MILLSDHAMLGFKTPTTEIDDRLLETIRQAKHITVLTGAGVLFYFQILY